MNKRFSATLALLLSSIPSLMGAGAPVRGAIFTTTGTGSAVNANQFDSKCSVYLDGGPGPNAPAHAAGLPDGDYYFQVTDPSGRNLLSTDVVSNRRFKVLNGVIVAYTGVAGPPHSIGADQDHPELGAITIRLANSTCPADYLDSPGAGGVYKVWATPVGDFVGNTALVDNDCGNGCFHGFTPSKSKTDNFKVKAVTPTFCLTVRKLLNGTLASEWPVVVTDPLGVVSSLFTDAVTPLQICGLGVGTYSVAEIFDPNTYVQVGLLVNGVPVPMQPVYAFTWAAGQPAPVIEFQNINLPPTLPPPPPQ